MIFLGGELRREAPVKALCSEKSFDYFAADAGLKLARQFSVSCRRILGDFDSMEQPEEGNPMVYPTEKDQTDSEIALNWALRDGYQTIWMIAPFGGRADHTVANFCLLETARQRGAALFLYDGENRAFLLSEGTHRLDPHYQYISFFPWDPETSVSLQGFQYPLDHYPLKREKPIGISNRPQSDKPVITIHQGAVLCICIEPNHTEDL